MRESELPDPMTTIDAISLRHESGSRVRLFLRMSDPNGVPFRWESEAIVKLRNGLGI